MSLSGHQRPHHGATDSWLTPPEIWQAVAKAADGFDLDPCAALENPGWVDASVRYTVEDDGLAQPWEGFRVVQSAVRCPGRPVAGPDG